MGIIRSNMELTARYKGELVAQVVYKGLRLVWMAVRSCFGKGIWRNDKPWINSDKWKNFK